MEDLRDDDTCLCLGQVNEETGKRELLLPREHGVIRMVAPKLFGWKSAKWLVKLEFADSIKSMGFWEVVQLILVAKFFLPSHFPSAIGLSRAGSCGRRRKMGSRKSERHLAAIDRCSRHVDRLWAVLFHDERGRKAAQFTSVDSPRSWSREGKKMIRAWLRARAARWNLWCGTAPQDRARAQGCACPLEKNDNDGEELCGNKAI